MKTIAIKTIRFWAWLFLLLVFMLPQIIMSQENKLIALEYYFDTDPGEGNATSVMFLHDSIIDMDFTIPLDGVEKGFHDLCFRTMDTTGVWSLTNIMKVYVDDEPYPVIPDKDIVEGEYFFNTDPGFGNGDQFSLSFNPEIDENFSIDVSDLALGFHKVFFRVKDEASVWSLTNVLQFYRDEEPDVELNLSLAEYFMDADPGEGNGAIVNVDNLPMVDTTFEVSRIGYEVGVHNLSVRVKDEIQNWSLTYTDQVEIFFKSHFQSDVQLTYTGQEITFTDLSTGVPTTWEWDFENDGVIDSYDPNPAWIYNEQGLYSVKLITNNNDHQDTLIRENYIAVIQQTAYFEPAWSEINQPMVINIFGADIEGEAMLPGDEIGIFDVDPGTQEEICVGTGLLPDTLINGKSLNVLVSLNSTVLENQINGFIEGNPFKFKLWSQTIGPIDEVTFEFVQPDLDEVFTADGYVEVILHGTTPPQIQQLISIPAGWHGISSYVDPFNPAMESICAGIMDELVIAMNMSSVFWPQYGINSIGDFNTHNGYYLKLTGAATLAIIGLQEEDRTFHFEQGWNLMPVLSACEVNAFQFLMGLGFNFIFAKEIGGQGILWPAQGLYSLENFVPGQAYFVKVAANCSFEFPDCEPDQFKHSNIGPCDPINTSPWPSPAIYAQTHIFTIKSNSIGAEQFVLGDYIGAFDLDGNCFGLAEWTGENVGMFLMSDDPTTEIKDGFFPDEPLNFRVYLSQNDEIIQVFPSFDPEYNSIGIFEANGLSVINSIEWKEQTSICSNLKMSISIFPNPAKGKFKINCKGLTENVRVEIKNTMGKSIWHNHTNLPLEIDLSSQPLGVYYILIKSGSELIMKKVIIQS